MELYGFGHENGIGVHDQTNHTHVPVKITIDKVKETEQIDHVYAKNSTSLAVYKSGKVYMWGENSFNMRMRKPKLFHHFLGGLRQITLGKRHGIALDKEGVVHVWGDGTYGELGLAGHQQYPVEKPIP